MFSNAPRGSTTCSLMFFPGWLTLVLASRPMVVDKRHQRKPVVPTISPTFHCLPSNHTVLYLMLMCCLDKIRVRDLRVNLRYD